MAEEIPNPQKEELKARALADPVTKEIRTGLEVRGYRLQEEPEVVLQYERGFVVIFRAVESQANQTPTPPERPRERPSFGREPYPKPRPATFGAGPAGLIYLGLDTGSRAFAVIDQTEQEKTLHIYLDGERTFRHAGDVLPQLRKNERFRKFEEWLKTHGKVVGAAGAILDETNHDIYIVIPVAPQQPYPRNPGLVETMALDPDVEVYMGLAKVLTVENNEVLVDPETLVLLPTTKTTDRLLPGFPVREVNPGAKAEIIDMGGPVYTVISGGEKPRAFQGLRDFAFFTARDTGERLHSGDTGQNNFSRFVPPTIGGLHQPETSGFSRRERSLTVFCWDLLNVPADNVLLQFKTDPELTLAAYNAAVRQDAYGVIAAKDTRSTSKPPVYLAGFSEVRLEDVKELYEKALRDFTSDQPYLVVPTAGVIHVVEHRLKMPLERLGELLLRLAEAANQGRFDEAYKELLPQGLSNLVEVFSRLIPEGWPGRERIPQFIKSLALEWQRRLLEKQLSPQVIGTVILNTALEKLLNLLWNAFVSFVQGDKVPKFAKKFCDNKGYFYIEPTPVQLGIHWGSFLRPWLDDWLTKAGFPKLKGLEDADSWKAAIFSVWGTRLGNPQTRKEAVVIISVIYKYATFAENIDFEVRVDEFKPYYHHLLKVMAFLDGALTRDHPSKWICAGISVAGVTETRLVLYRDETRRGETVRDIAVVNFLTAPDSSEDFEKIYNWVESEISTFTGRREYNPMDPIRFGKNTWEVDGRKLTPGFDIAAVVFTDPVSPKQAAEIRKLVDRMDKNLKNLPGLSEHGYDIIDPDDVAARAVVVTWKEEDEKGNVTNWVSIIELGPGKISDAEKHRIAQAFAGRNYQEYKPNTSSSHSSSSPPPSGSSRFSRPVVVDGVVWAEDDRPVPCAIP